MIKSRKILSVIYTDLLYNKLSLRNSMLYPPLVSVGLSYDGLFEGAYTHHDKSGNVRIVIGGKLVSKIANLPDAFADKEKFRPFFDDIIRAFYGLHYHEVCHGLFTDMKDTSIALYPEIQYRGFLHNLFNMLEDPTVEISLSNLFYDKFPSEINPKEYFNFMIERIFIPQCAEYKDDGSLNAFMNYMLLMLRCGKAAIPVKNEIWEKYCGDLIPLIKEVLYESDPTERIHKTITLGEWIINNITEFDWSEIEEPDETTKVSGSGGTPGVTPSKTISSSRTSSEDPFETIFKESDEESDEESEEGDDSVGDGTSEEKSSEEDVSEDETEYSDPEETLDDVESIDDVFNDILRDGGNHEWVIAKDEYTFNDSAVDAMDEQLDEFNDVVNDISKFLNLFKGRLKPRELSGFTSGKLNIFRAMQDEFHNGSDLKLFNRKITRGKAPDLAVSLVCDNSGSMDGLKSEICSRAVLALAQACEWTNIPFECNAFTKTDDSWSGTCITIHIKDFDESLEKAKPYFCINDSDHIRKLHSEHYIPTFRGNSEEVNLFYIGKKFARIKHSTKLMIVLCDGCTTGSRSDLSNVVKSLTEDDNIIVIGIGICNDGVADIYPKHEIFGSLEELNGLGEYLVNTLSEYAK